MLTQWLLLYRLCQLNLRWLLLWLLLFLLLLRLLLLRHLLFLLRLRWRRNSVWRLLRYGDVWWVGLQHVWFRLRLWLWWSRVRFLFFVTTSVESSLATSVAWSLATSVASSLATSIASSLATSVSSWLATSVAMSVVSSLAWKQFLSEVFQVHLIAVNCGAVNGI